MQPEQHALNNVNGRDKLAARFEVKDSLKVNSVKYPNDLSLFLPSLI